MIKIEYTNEIISRHKKYFKENILQNFSVAGQDCPDIFPPNHSDFLTYCADHWETLATGTFGELKIIDEEINDQFRDVLEVFRRDRKSPYRKVLLDIFGYSDFCRNDIFEYLRKIAKTQAPEIQESCPNVLQRIKNILRALFPEHISEIEKLNVDSSKEAFGKEVRKLDFLIFTDKNFPKAEILKDHWNDYIFVLMSGVRVCPYCNRQYISPVYSVNGKVRGDIDHFLPRSVYPYFSMSLYNLIPVCKSCNQALKRDRAFNFDNLNPLVDSLDDYFTFRADLITNEISIEPSLEKWDKIKEHIETFKLKPLYNYHQNQVGELLKKHVIYTDRYIDELIETHTGIFPSKEHVKQLIFGVTYDKKRLNEEAFHKLRRDIDTQLNLLINQNSDQISKLKEILITKI